MTTVLMTTNKGNIKIELDDAKAPKTVANFVEYVNQGHFSNTIFHRVIKDFMIQGGGFDEKLHQKPTNKPIPIESKNGLSNVRYSLAMARMGNPDSATSQWFINVNDNIGLDYPGQDGYGYAVFGKVIQGQEVVDKIKGVLVDDVRGMENVPVTPVVIKSASIVKAK